MTTRSLILFPHEVRAALDDRLGLVVRPVRPSAKGCKVGTYHSWEDGVAVVEPVNVQEDGDPWTDIKCPFGVPGDRLRCKEAWKTFDDEETGRLWVRHKESEYPSFKVPAGVSIDPLWAVGPWLSPATMPAWASRITLEVKGVRCVRVKDISYADALKCGFCDGVPGALVELERSWTAKYGPRYPWETSWAWAVNVRRVEG